MQDFDKFNKIKMFDYPNFEKSRYFYILNKARQKRLSAYIKRKNRAFYRAASKGSKKIKSKAV